MKAIAAFHLTKSCSTEVALAVIESVRKTDWKLLGVSKAHCFPEMRFEVNNRS